MAVLPGPIRNWFGRRFRQATLAQRLAWPAVSEGRNLLLSSPTGSGKTLAVFLPVFGAIVPRRFEDSPPGVQTSGIKCLYLSPLRALANDIHKNLQQTIREIDAFGPCPVRLGVWTGDTSSHHRQRMRLNPPDILITTPESLALLLVRKDACELLAGVRTVIVDEVHSLACNKRGADLSLSLERLSRLTKQDPQRVGLSASCHPIEEVARWLAGRGRDIRVAQAAEAAPLGIQVEYLDEDDLADSRGFIALLCSRLKPIFDAGDTTLVFANTRALAELITWGLRRRFPDLAGRVAIHHSSVAAQTRFTVEEGLRSCKLRVVVTSTSLELGIDIGSVDQVVLVHPPGGAARLLQRLGRSGRGPGKPRRGIVYTSNTADLLEAVVTAGAGQSGQLEPLRVRRNPLDVLCQQLVGMSIEQPWTAAEAFDLVRGAYPFRDLSLGDFSDCLKYLSGGGNHELPARLGWDGDRFQVAGSRTARIYRMNAGTILGEDVREVRIDAGPAVGSVTSFFADRLLPGDRFLLDGRCLELTHGNGEELLVREAPGFPATVRWASGYWSMPQALAERLWCFRVRAKEALLEGAARLAQFLAEEYDLRGPAAERLVALFDEQEALSEIPVAGLFVEASPSTTGEHLDYSFHLPLSAGGAEAVARALLQRMGLPSRALVASGALGFTIASSEPLWFEPDGLRRLLRPDGFEIDLQRSLADSQLVGQRFANVAMTGLMLLKNPLRRRRRVGGQSWAARRLFHWLRLADPDFPLLRQAAREVREDVLDVRAGLVFLERLARQPIWLRHLPGLSPLARTWFPAEPPADFEGALRQVSYRTEAIHAAS